MAPVDGEDVGEVGGVDRPPVTFGHFGCEGVHADRHAHPPDSSDIPLLDQVADVAGARGEAALQPDDVSDPIRLGQRQELLRLRGAGGQRPLAVDLLTAGDRSSREARVFGARGEDHHQVDVRVGDEVLMGVERVSDLELRGEAVGGRLFVRLDTATISKSSRVLRAGIRTLLLMNCPCVRRAGGAVLPVRRAEPSAQECGFKVDGAAGAVFVEGVRAHADLVLAAATRNAPASTSQRASSRGSRCSSTARLSPASRCTRSNAARRGTKSSASLPLRVPRLTYTWMTAAPERSPVLVRVPLTEMSLPPAVTLRPLKANVVYDSPQPNG